MAKPMISLKPTKTPGIFTDGSDFEPLWSRSKDFGGEVRYWHQSGYGSLPESDVQVVANGVPAPAELNARIAECLRVLRPQVQRMWPHEQALEELAGYATRGVDSVDGGQQ